MTKHFILAAALLATGVGVARANDYYIVVPVPNRTAPDTIDVSLGAVPLPDGVVGEAYPSVNLYDGLRVTGDAGFAGDGVTWRVSQGSLPAGLVLDAAAGRLSGMPQGETALAGQSFEVSATYKDKTGSAAFNLTVTSREPRSCKEYLVRNPGAPSSWYSLDPDGSGPRPRGSYYCDMTSDGGGWTLVVRQLEADPTTTWNGGGSAGGSFAMGGAGIPAHTQVAFGKDYVATALDYVTWTYTGGDIPKTLVVSPKTGASYHVHRSSGGHYSDHDPESGYGDQVTVWSNTLTFDRVGGYDYTWAFSPNIGNEAPAARGYAFHGPAYYAYDSFAWTVWVR